MIIAPNTLNRLEVRDYLAGTRDERLSDLNGLIASPEIDLILAARGGYGCSQLLDGIDWDLLRERRLGIVGYSDITSLSLAALARAGLIGYSGIMATAGDGFGETSLDPSSAASFFDAVGGKAVLEKSPDDPPWTLHRGPKTVAGPVVPVCLSLLETALGTPFVPDLTGAILVIEDVEERLYAVDRSLTQLRHAGILDSLAAVLVGSFNGVNPEHDAQLSVEVPKLALELCPERVAVASGVAYGHIPRRFTLPVGGGASVNLEAGTFTLLRA